MSKITLDIMNYTLFEQKPIDYEFYMRIYGHSNTSQISTQTNDNLMDQSCQTNTVETETIWTQYPPYFGGFSICDYRPETNLGKLISHGDHSERFIDSSLLKINKMLAKPVSQVQATTTVPKDSESLRLFLLQSAITIAGILGEVVSSPVSKLYIKEVSAETSITSRKFCAVKLLEQSELLKKTEIRFLYGNYEIPNTLYAVHSTDVSKEKSATSSSPSSYVSVWNMLELNRLSHLLFVWTERIECIEVHMHLQDVVMAGMSNGYVTALGLLLLCTYYILLLDQFACGI